jgi:DNA invertase Pin-like site-specific DNA recombinase
MSSLTGLRAIIPARLSRKQKNGEQGIGLDTQDEKSREFCDFEGMTVVTVTRDTITGSKAPMDRKNFGPWVTDPARIAQYDVIVAYKTDRLSRGTDVDWSRIETWAADNGKRLIIVGPEGGIQYPSRNDSDFWQWSAMKRQAGNELEAIKERSGRARNAIAERGGFMGRTPWGLTTMGEKYSRQLVATAEGAEILPAIFRRVAAGESLHAVARWLTAQQGGKWWPRTVGGIIRNPAYMGLYCERDADSPTGYGKTLYGWDGIVSPALWQQANRSLDTRPQRRSGPRATGETEPLSATTFCYPCSLRGVDSPMYRVGGLLRCTGRGADRRGCGNCIPLDVARRLADQYLGGLNRPIYEISVVAGNEAELRDRKARLDLERRQLAMRGLSFDQEDAERARLREAYVALEAAVVVPDRRRARPTGESYGQRWTRLTADERAAWLKSGEVSVLFGRDLPDGVADATETVQTTLYTGFGQARKSKPRTVTYGLVAAWDSEETSNQEES